MAAGSWAEAARCFSNALSTAARVCAVRCLTGRCFLPDRPGANVLIARAPHTEPIYIAAAALRSWVFPSSPHTCPTGSSARGFAGTSPRRRPCLPDSRTTAAPPTLPSRGHRTAPRMPSAACMAACRAGWRPVSSFGPWVWFIKIFPS